MAWRGGPTGVGEQGMSTWGSPGTWEALSSPRVNQDKGDWLIKPLACSDERSVTDRSEPASESGTAKRRQRSAAGRTTGSRSAPYYRRSWGTDPPGPSRGKGAPDCGASERNDGGHTKARNHLNETADDSSTGAASAGAEFHVLNHYMDLDWLREAYRRTRKDGAVGVDHQTAKAYAEHLEENLQDLLNRAKSGRYRARRYVGPISRKAMAVHAPDRDTDL